MLRKWIKPGCAFLRAAWVEERRLGALSRRLGLEVLEDRTAPAVVAWQGPPRPAKPADKADWSTNPPWVGAAVPGAKDTAVFAQAVSSPVLSKKAIYAGDSTYPGSTSNTIVETVQRASAMEMESTSNSYALFGQAVTFTATIYSMGGVAPTGTVSFFDGSTLLATINLSQVGTSFQAAFTTSTLSRGSHTIVAVYSGDVDYNSASASVGETIS